MMVASRIAKKNKQTFFSKARTLAALYENLHTASVLPLFYFTKRSWLEEPNKVLIDLFRHEWANQSVIVRSSSLNEDTEISSGAGKYDSILNVNGEAHLISAINQVVASFGDSSDEDEVLVQPMVENVKIAGVLFTADPNTNSPYYILNYDSHTGDTTTITGGNTNHHCQVIHRSVVSDALEFSAVLALAKELEARFECDSLDIEFAITNEDELILFQVRPLILSSNLHLVEQAHHVDVLKRIEEKIKVGLTRHPYLYGGRTVYGIMPDWNPAEIIGIRPKPLAMSLYRELITDAVWAYQRSNYGYKNLRSFPLLLDFEGLPYIDVRVSFNSFLPDGLSDIVSEKLVNYYVEKLSASPELHDKVEFDIVYSCYTLDLSERLSCLAQEGFSTDEIQEFKSALIRLTNQIINHKAGLWRGDLEKIEELKIRQAKIMDSSLDINAKIYWLIEDCKRYGTLPFAGLARAGFVAVQLLRSFVNVGILTPENYTDFIASVNSVSSDMTTDFMALSRESFLKKYGHLRPGTYDILSARYDESPDYYFDWSNTHQNEPSSHSNFTLSIQQLRRIQEYIDRDQLNVSALELLEFIKIAIESREYAKFIFTKSVSDILKLIELYAAQHHIDRVDCAYLSIQTLINLYSCSRNPSDMLKQSIETGKNQHKITCSIQLPSLIVDSSDIYQFSVSQSLPNFITQKQAIGKCTNPASPREELKDSIMFIPSADPGYDWIFTTGIAGFVTQYGGVNSHMAIRAGELGLPAVIGCGGLNYSRWKQSNKIKIDCENRQVISL
jgi:phosphohistidine swiveling domain-containing protein